MTISEDPKKVLSKAESSHDRALNRFAVHKSINDKVKSLKEKYNVNENLEKILEPGKKKQKKLKHLEAKTKKKHIKQENAKAAEIKAKREAWLEEHNVTPMVAGDDVENNNGESQVIKLNNNDEVDSESSEKDVNESSECNSENEGKFVKINNTTKTNLTITDNNKTKTKNIESEDEADTATKTVDDFFITDSGTHYESTYVPKPVKEQIHDDGLNRQQRRAQQFGNIVKKKKPKKLNKEFLNNVKAKPKIEKEKFGNKNKKTVEVESKQEVSLHPSWEAKKKLKPQITAFQGKKIVFDD